MYCLLGLSYLDLDVEIVLLCLRTNFPLSDSGSSVGTGSKYSSENIFSDIYRKYSKKQSHPSTKEISYIPISFLITVFPRLFLFLVGILIVL